MMYEKALKSVRDLGAAKK